MQFKNLLLWFVLVTMSLSLVHCNDKYNSTKNKNDIKPWPTQKDKITKKNNNEVANDAINVKKREGLLDEKNELVSKLDSFKIEKSYKIAVILPFKLDSIYGDSISVKSKSIPKGMLPSLDFWEGCLLAVDSLRKTNVNYVVQLFDYSGWNNDFTKFATAKKLEDFDVLIGALNSTDAKKIADYAKAKKILYVSPLANTFVPERNPYYISLNPFAVNHQKIMLSNFYYDASVKNIVIIRGNNNVDAAMSQSTKAVLKEKIPEWILDANASTDTLKNCLIRNKRNHIFITSNDANYVTSMLRKLSILSDDYVIAVYGMQGWGNIDNLKTNVTKSLEVYFSNSFSLQKSGTPYTNFSKKFSEKFKFKPSEMSCRGYCTLLLCSEFLKYGKAFNYFINNKNYTTLYNTINIVPYYYQVEHSNSKYIQYYYNQNVNLFKITSKGSTITPQIVE